MLEAVRVDGEMMAIPFPNLTASGINVMWIRKDWLDELGLEPPRTIKEVIRTGELFTEHQMGGEGTVGILGPGVDEELNAVGKCCFGLTPLFSAFHAYPQYWLKDEEGNLTYEKECMPCEPLDLVMAAKASGAIVIAQVERVAQAGSLDPRDVKIPGMLVDYVCVAEHPENIMQTHITHFNPAFTGEIKVPIKKDEEEMPLDPKKVFTRRAAMEIHRGDKCNMGIGMPGLIPKVLIEEGVD